MTPSKSETSGSLLLVFAAWFVLAGQGAAGVPVASPGLDKGQQILDFIAVIPFVDTFKELQISTPPRGPFSSWPSDDQHAFPAKLEMICASFWSFIHMPANTKVLPDPLPVSDEAALGLDLCLVGHMPSDWPERPAKLRSATAILARAKQAGSSLHVPSSISP